MNYHKTTYGEDEWAYSMFQPVGGEHHYQWEEVADDYDLVESNPWFDEVLLKVLPDVARVAASLDIEAPYATWAEDQRGWLARYVEGTRPPVFLLDPRPADRFRNPSRFIYDSLLHELGHVYLRSVGLPYEEEEEEVVERFALAGGKSSILFEYERSWE